MNLRLEQLESAFKIQNSLLEDFRQELLLLPYGYLAIKKSKGYSGLYHVYLDGDRTREIGIKKATDENLKRINALRRRYCVQKSISVLEKNTKALENSIKQYRTFDPVEIAQNMPEAYHLHDKWNFTGIPDLKEMPGHFDPLGRSNININEAIEEQMKKLLKYETNLNMERGFRKDSLIFDTGLGFNVRSKSEMLIATALNQYNVLYLYEMPVLMGGRWIYPDFVFVNENGQATIWEHFGLVDDVGYARNMTEKIVFYTNHGFIPYKNLIITTESSSHPLDLFNIKKIIEMYC